MIDATRPMMDPALPPNPVPLVTPVDNLTPENITLIPVVEEQIRVDKRVVETGRVLIAKQVTERQETVDVPLNHEEVNVERVSINRYVDSPPEATRYEGDTLIISVMKEVVVVEKRLMLVEELHVTKRQTQTKDTQQVTLRTEEVTITRHPGSPSEDEPTSK